MESMMAPADPNSFQAIVLGTIDFLNEDQENLDEEQLEEINRFKLKRRKAPEKLRLKKRSKAKARLKGKADTELFKRKFRFDKKKNKFIKKKKIQTKADKRKQDRKWLRLMKRRRH